MSDIAIRVENLGKQYRIGGPQAQYKTIRESLAGTVQAPFRRLASAIRGQSSGASNETIWALKDVSFEVKRGEVVGVIGRNGAGKTTLLKILSRITEPTEGEADIHGRVGSLLEVGTGFHPELTGRENIYLSGAILGMRKDEIERKFDEIVDFAEIEKFMNTPVKRYSSGMYVRLAFSVAAHLEPEILLVDEVLAVGDLAFQNKCLGKMTEVAHAGRTVLFVSHNLVAISRLCDTSVLLGNGTLCAVGPTDEVVTLYYQRARDLHSTGAKDVEVEVADDSSKLAQVVRVRLLDASGDPKLTYEVREQIQIAIDFLLRQDCSSIVTSFQVRNTHDEVIYVSTDADWLNHAGGAQGNVYPKKAGRYQCQISLPTPMLNCGIYELVVFLFSPKNEIFDSVRSRPFEVVDRGSFASVIFDQRRRGHLAVPIEWKTSYEEFSSREKSATQVFSSD